MASTRYDRGYEKLRAIDGELGEQVIASLQDIAPDVSKYIIEFAFGDVYSRSTLDLKQREMISITSLATLGGCEKQLEIHIQGALNVGATKNDVVETLMQCIPYIGFPRVLNAITVAKNVFSKST